MHHLLFYVNFRFSAYATYKIFFDYAFLIVFPKKSKSNEPAIATKNAIKLNSATDIPKIRFATKPPTSAPTTPKRIDPRIPFLLGEESIAFATRPTINPNKIHESIFITFTSLPGIVPYAQFY